MGEEEKKVVLSLKIKYVNQVQLQSYYFMVFYQNASINFYLVTEDNITIL